MKHVTIDRKNAASAEVPVEELTPQSGPPAERYTHRIVLNVFGKRFELTRHTAVRVISKGPAKVIEMPIRTTIES
ncbi:MAG: hypothetical protein ABSG41_27970 [Bryobacteraceae bacterium]